jgi:long-subunit fatty acid transport protein
VTGVQTCALPILPFYDRNSFVFAIGLEYSGENNLKYRIGYNYQTTPNSDRSYSLLLPNVNQHRISAGIGFLFNQFYLDLSIAYSVGVAKDIKKSQDEYFYGKYDTKTIIPSINVEYQL